MFKNVHQDRSHISFKNNLITIETDKQTLILNMTKIDPRNANFEHHMPPVYECPECNFKTDDKDFMAEHIYFKEHEI